MRALLKSRDEHVVGRLVRRDDGFDPLVRKDVSRPARHDGVDAVVDFERREVLLAQAAAVRLVVEHGADEPWRQELIYVAPRGHRSPCRVRGVLDRMQSREGLLSFGRIGGLDTQRHRLFLIEALLHHLVALQPLFLLPLCLAPLHLDLKRLHLGEAATRSTRSSVLLHRRRPTARVLPIRIPSRRSCGRSRRALPSTLSLRRFSRLKLIRVLQVRSHLHRSVQRRQKETPTRD
mmetsp:Transcript_22656/g.73681  ORF Transcript_22656/g.73681 Transcript_22656/m.73681 type:complete len:234 (+) Transcript_22656:1867-2568(+)